MCWPWVKRRYSRGDAERAPGYPPYEGRGPPRAGPYGNGPSGPPPHGPPGAQPGASEYASANGRANGPPPPPPPRDANDFSRGPPPADRHLFNAHANEHAHTNGVVAPDSIRVSASGDMFVHSVYCG
jgi:hypothetical protein